MDNNNDEIKLLLEKLDILKKQQDTFSRKIQELSSEVYRLKGVAIAQTAPVTQEPMTIEAPDGHLPGPNREQGVPDGQTVPTIKPLGSQILYPEETGPRLSASLEKFIGENLINKIGIVITVIGIAIGAKYSIDHQLISPIARIVLGYMAGLALLGFGARLKKDYKNYSAVLVSGGMAVMYFITYFAYGFYQLMPQTMAFALMVLFTAFTVFAALRYNNQVIALIGLVGAYSVPFLLGDGTGNVAVLFGYMAIINVGILEIAFKKYWKPLNYASFAISWSVYLMWYDKQYQVQGHFGTALAFVAIFFVTFYLMFLAYKLIKKEKFGNDDIWLLLANSFIFYGIGYSILDSNPNTQHLLGLFSIANAIVHFVVGFAVYRQKSFDRNLYYFVAGLVLVFVTIAIPVQLESNWVTLFWAGEAAMLFWIGRSKHDAVYEKLSYILMALAFTSLVQDWSISYGTFVPDKPETRIFPIFNINFLTSLLFVASFGYINLLNSDKRYHSPLKGEKGLRQLVSMVLPAIFLFALYYSVKIEIDTYWDQSYAATAVSKLADGQQSPQFFHDPDLLRYKSVWSINYTLLFLTVLSFVNFEKHKNIKLGHVVLALCIFADLVFLSQGLYALGELRESYLAQSLAQYYHRGAFNIGIRYVSMFFIALMLFSASKYIHRDFFKRNFNLEFDTVFHITFLWVLSSELINWMDIVGQSENSYKLGLSILWGLYALVLISLGIWKRKKHLRVSAIALFALTLAKLFVYDISHLDTIAKTVVFVVLGILLLIISFLYNKFKSNILEE